MITTLKPFHIPGGGRVHLCHIHEDNKVLAFSRGDLLFVFNFHSTCSHNNYPLPVSPGRYEMIFNSDEKSYGGSGRLVPAQVHFTLPSSVQGTPAHLLHLYLPTRTALVLLKP